MPANRRGRQEPMPPPGPSILRIPQADAEEILRERIEAGKQIVSGTTSASAGLAALRRKAASWRDYNRTWLDKHLGGEAADEYMTTSTHMHFGSARDPAVNMRWLREEVEQEIAKLESIHDRLGMWVQETNTAVPRSGHVSLDAPIFIVHGSDTLRAESVAHTIQQATGRKTIILREQPNSGRTIIEKFEQHAAEVSYAVIVLTADDKGCRAHETETRPRGRQNVILEMGYFYGLIGRDRVSVLLQPGVEKPSDMDGIVYITFDDNGAWKTELFRELRHADFDIHL